MILEGATGTSLLRWKVADVGERALYVEAMTKTFAADDGSVGGLIVSPHSILVREPGREYVVRLGEGEADSLAGQLLDLFL